MVKLTRNLSVQKAKTNENQDLFSPDSIPKIGEPPGSLFLARRRGNWCFALPRDDRARESALARPQNNFLYEERDLTDLATAYAHEIIKNHIFNDGNKRTAFAITADICEFCRWEFSVADQLSVH
jgi:hypothetical protein